MKLKTLLVLVSLAAVCISQTSCTHEKLAKNNMGNTTPESPSAPISDVLARHTEEWMRIPGVTGTGEGEVSGKPAIVIFINERTPAVDSLPKSVEGYSLDVRNIGTVRAQ